MSIPITKVGFFFRCGYTNASNAGFDGLESFSNVLVDFGQDFPDTDY